MDSANFGLLGIINNTEPGAVAHICNPSNSGGMDQEEVSLDKNLVTFHLNKKSQM
jgi:hypothetical protein